MKGFVEKVVLIVSANPFNLSLKTKNFWLSRIDEDIKAHCICIAPPLKLLRIQNLEMLHDFFFLRGCVIFLKKKERKRKKITQSLRNKIKKIKNFLKIVLVLLSASVERFSVSRMQGICICTFSVTIFLLFKHSKALHYPPFVLFMSQLAPQRAFQNINYFPNDKYIFIISRLFYNY